MQGWKEVLLAFGVTLSIGSFIGMVLLLNSGRKIDKSQQEIRQEKITQAQSARNSESRSDAKSTTIELPEYETESIDEGRIASSENIETSEDETPNIENEISENGFDHQESPRHDHDWWLYPEYWQVQGARKLNENERAYMCMSCNKLKIVDITLSVAEYVL
ncbi:hypothetical protein R7892_09950 [Ligilactobacillus murinus]|uniref:hypothetical protein n=1 Tax=Ligilactobacillus murinus TaxID=1622 RepID=UPI00296AAEF1|nr:hypothetical protein [Ligilactobacillus murinus]WOY88989.1 hypothetical protein R7892_09950 [Ligilactobacillus murinus]